MREPGLFYTIAHLVLPPDGKFSLLHAFLKLLQDKHKLLRNYTQNIDNLEQRAGLKLEKLVQCHGSFAKAKCVSCQGIFAGEKFIIILEENKFLDVLFVGKILNKHQSILVP